MEVSTNLLKALLLCALWSWPTGHASGGVSWPPKTCNTETWFKQGRRYEYQYEVTTNTGVTEVGLTEATAGSQLSCRLVVNVPSQCELALELLDCDLRDRTTTGKSVSILGSQELARDLSRSPVYVHYDEGEVVNHKMVVSDSDPQHIINIKRGVVSLLQLKLVSNDSDISSPVQQYDIFGSCSATMKSVQEPTLSVETYRDLVMCNLSHINRQEIQLLSFIKAVQGGHRFAPISEITYPFESDVSCHYMISPSSSIGRALCTQRQSFHPFSSGSASRQAQTTIRQRAELLSESQLDSDVVYQPLDGRREVDLSMSFDMKTKTDQTMQAVDSELDQMLIDYLGQGDSNILTTDLPADSLRRVLDVMRAAEESELRLSKEKVFTCRDSLACYVHLSPSLDHHMLQSVKEKLFLNSLMSCGTEACLVVFAECLRDDLVSDFETRSVIYNMGLFYYASPQVISIILEHCKNKQNSGCWMALSGMINRLTSSAETTEETRGIVFNTVQQLRQIIGENCRHGVLDDLPHAEKVVTEDSLLTAIKAITNIGQPVVELYDSKVDKDKSVIPVLMLCVTNKQLSVVITRASVQALDNIGLRPDTVNNLLTVVEDETRPVAMRAAVFDVLIMCNDKQVLWSLLNLVDMTKLENMQTYIVTKVSTVMEGLDPRYEGLRSTLRDILRNRRLPNLGDNILSKSHYTQYSHYITLPLTSLNLGGHLALNLIYTPTSNVFHSLTFSSGLIIDDYTTQLLDVTVDLEGVDTFIELMNSNKENASTNPLEILDMLQKYLSKTAQGKTPKFAHFHYKVESALQKIFHLANIQKAAFPQAHVSYKLFGYEMGTFSSDSLLMMLKQLQMKGDPITKLTKMMTSGLDTALLRAFKLCDLHKVLPTVSGFPLETHLDATVVTKAIVKMKMDMRDFVQNKKHIVTDIAISPSMSASFQAQMKVFVPGYTSTVLGMTASTYGMGDWTGVVKVLPAIDPVRGTHDLQLISAVGQDEINFFKFKSEIYLQHNGQEMRTCPTQAEETFEKCLPDVYTQVLGRKMCMTCSYHSATEQGALPSPLTGPFNLEGILTPIDEVLDHFSLSVSLQKKVSAESKPYGYHLDVVFEGLGAELSRQVLISADTDHSTGSLEVMCRIPDLEAEFRLDQIFFQNATHHHKKVSSVITQHGKALSSFIAEHKNSHIPRVITVPDHMRMEFEEKFFHLNISMGVVSVDFILKNYAPAPTYKKVNINLIYYCEPQLKLLYGLHPNPELAAKENHRSSFTYVQETTDSKTSFADIWKGLYKMIILVPGHNITQVTYLIADLKGAHRDTAIYWTRGEQLDTIHMDSTVYNRSTSNDFHYDYHMNLVNKDHFEMQLEGLVMGPAARPLSDLMVRTDVIYKSVEGAVEQRSKRSVSSILTGLSHAEQAVEEKVAAVYNSVKMSIFGFWAESETEEEETNTVATRQALSDGTGEEKKKIPFWDLPQWSIGIDMGITMIPHLDPKFSGAGPEMVGVEFQWIGNASMPRGVNQLFSTKGSLFRGQKKWIKFDLVDNTHDINFKWQAEHFHTPLVFHHQHNWSLVETQNHNIDRSFNLRVDFEHYQHLEYDLELMSPRTNLTHHINYTKLSPSEHMVRAHARLHSVTPMFDLLYNESSDVVHGNLKTYMNLNSTLLDYRLDLIKEDRASDMKVMGNLHLNGRVPMLKGKRTLSLFLSVARRQPPLCDVTYSYQDGSGSKFSIAMLGPKQIRIGMNLIPPSNAPAHIPESSLTWYLELVEPRRLKNTFDFSPPMLHIMRNIVGKLIEHTAHTIKQTGEQLAYNLVVDWKDKILPVLNQSIDSYLKRSLHEAMAADPECSSVKLYKISLGAVDSFNNIWVARPTVQMMRKSHLDQGLAISVKTLSSVLSDWVLHPSFFMRQFAKFHVYPTLHSAIESRSISFSIPLLFMMPAFNKLPSATVLEKEVMAVVKRKVSGTTNIAKYVAVMLDGKMIKTFDGLIYDIAAPPHSLCTYLLGADLRQGQFALTYTREGLTAVTGTYGLTLAHDGSVASVGIDTLSSLPYTSPDGQIALSLSKGEFHLSIAHGLVHVVSSPIDNFYLVEMDRKLNNASLGLLGTNNLEMGDDFQLADGTRTEAGKNFQNSYELTGNTKCSVSSPPAPQPCKKFYFPACMSLSDQWPQVLPCLLMISPQPYIIQCQIAECQGRSGCGAIRAYLAACQHHGIDVSLPPVCEKCQKQSGLDIVFVQSLTHDVVISKDSLSTIRSVITTMPSNFDLSVGVVTYGGKEQWVVPRSHLLNGKLLENDKRALRHVEMSADPGQGESNAYPALLMAANYPFRAEASKVILLLYGHQQMHENQDYTPVQNLLRERGITFVTASDYSEFSSKKVLGKWSHGEVIGKGRSVTSPQDAYSDLVLATGGMWLDLDTLNSGRSRKMRQVVSQLTKLSAQSAQHCSP